MTAPKTAAPMPGMSREELIAFFQEHFSNGHVPRWITDESTDLEMLRSHADAIREATAWERQAGHSNGRNGGKPKRSIVLTNAADIVEEDVSWLWKPYVPRGFLILLMGDEGAGKTTFDSLVVARTTRGKLPGQTEPERVLIIGDEDSWAQQWKPQLRLAGANLALVDFARAKYEGDEDDVDESIMLPDDADVLQEKIETVGFRSVVIDPLESHQKGARSAFDPLENRQLQSPLIRLAHRTGATIIGNVHTNRDKSSSGRGRMGGSFTKRQSARHVLVLGWSPDKPDEKSVHRVLAVDKSNLLGPKEKQAISLKLDGDGLGRGFMEVGDEVEFTVKQVLEATNQAAGVETRGGKVSKDLNDDRIPALKGRWTQPTVSTILRSPIYRGKLHLKGEEYDGLHEAIISDDMWNAAAASRISKSRPGQGRGRPSRRFLFTRGMLKCRCGASLVVHSASDTYQCMGRRNDPRSCDQGKIKRELIDGSLTSYFMREGFDDDATRAELLRATQGRLEEARQLRRQAEREVTKAIESFTRVRSDYKAGVITAAEWREFAAELESERQAAEAEVEPLRRREMAAVPPADEQLAELRATVGSCDLAAIRAALQRLFVGFHLGTSDLAAELVDELAPETDNLLDPVEVGGGLVVWAELSPAAVLGIDDQAPILDRQPLRLDGQNDSVALPIQYLFRPIPCGIGPPEGN
jgi:hypothetical protein